MAPFPTLNARFFTKNRLEHLENDGHFECTLKDVARYCANSKLTWFGNREKSDSRGSKKSPSRNSRKEAFKYVFAKCSPSFKYRNEVIMFLAKTFMGEARGTTQKSPEAKHIHDTFEKSNSYCQIIYAIKEYGNKTAEDRVVVGVCLYHLEKELAFVSYVAHYTGAYTAPAFGYIATVPARSGDCQNFDHTGMEALFFHQAQLYGALLAKLPKREVFPLWLQVARNQNSVAVHKRYGLRPDKISGLPAHY